MSDWLSKLEPRDAVVVRSSYGLPVVVSVIRITKTMICTHDGRKWRRDTGRFRGGAAPDYSTSWLDEWSQDAQDEVERRSLENWLYRAIVESTAGNRKLPLELLRELKARIEVGGDHES